MFQDILWIRHIYSEPGTLTAGASGTPAAVIPSAATVHSDQRATGHSNPRHCVWVEGAKAHIRCQNRLHYLILYESSTNRTHYLRYHHCAGATHGSSLSRLLSTASALPAFSLRWLDFNLTFELFAI